MPEIAHEIKVEGAPAAVLAALTTADGLRAWHTPHVTGTGAVGTDWDLAFTGRPDFVWRIEESSDERVVWRCVAGPGDAPGTTATFHVSPLDDGRTLVALTHAGWPHDGGSFRACNTLWGVLLFHLAQAVRTGEPSPAFD